jgi:hypothetical protein
MAVEPIVDHRMSQRFRLLAVAGNDFPCAFNITGMNGYAPLIPFDPGADGVSYTSVFHQGTLRSNWKPSNNHRSGACAPGAGSRSRCLDNEVALGLRWLWGLRLGLDRELFPIVRALEPKCFAFAALIQTGQLPTRFGFSTQRERIFNHIAL